MNTRYKFRAWDEENKKWLTDTEEVYLCEDGDVVIMIIGKGWDQGDSLKRVKATVCLFTGLQDKNGKEIFEGDIVIVGSRGKKCKVVFDNGCFYTPYEKSKYRLGGWKKTAVEVIGNIYEHPHLLKQSTNQK